MFSGCHVYLPCVELAEVQDTSSFSAQPLLFLCLLLPLLIPFPSEKDLPPYFLLPIFTLLFVYNLGLSYTRNYVMFKLMCLIFSFNIVLLSCIHFSTNDLFLFRAQWYSIKYKYHIFSVHSSADGHIVCIQILNIMKCAAVNMEMHTYRKTFGTIKENALTECFISESVCCISKTLTNFLSWVWAGPRSKWNFSSRIG